MKRVSLFLIASYACILSSPSALGQRSNISEPYLFGMWEGTMNIIEQSSDTAPAVPPFQGQQSLFRLDIRDTNLVMYFPNGSEWIAFGEGLDLRLNEQRRSAVVAVGVSDGTQGRPSESWMLNIARWDEENITVYWTRLTARDEANGQPPVPFAAIGQMQRIGGDD